MSLSEFWQMCYLIALHKTGDPEKAYHQANLSVEYYENARRNDTFESQTDNG